jgi:hypothetical protein
MTIRELIRDLQVYKPEAEVAFCDHNDNEMELSHTSAQFPDYAPTPFAVFWLDRIEKEEEHNDAD